MSNQALDPVVVSWTDTNQCREEEASPASAPIVIDHQDQEQTNRRHANTKYLIQTNQPASSEDNGKVLFFADCVECGSPRMIKIYRGPSKSRGLLEAYHLQQLHHHHKTKEYVVEMKTFHPQAVYQNQPCSALVMMGRVKGARTLQHLMLPCYSKQMRDWTVETMKQIAQSLKYLHGRPRQMMHGAIRLENVVNFSTDPVPDYKLVNFQNSCPFDQPLRIPWNWYDSAEYCPPELAVQIVKNLDKESDYCKEETMPTRLLRASGTFDVWCFGVLWMKYLFMGDVLPDFQDLQSPKEIVSRIAQDDFSFENTIQQLLKDEKKKVSHGMIELITFCTDRNPLKRPSCHEILEHPLIGGPNTDMLKRLQERHELVQHLETMLQLLQKQRNAVWSGAKLDLPCLWVLLPWGHDRHNHSKISSLWHSLCKNDMELKFLCDAAFDDPQGQSQCACSSDYLDSKGLLVRNSVCPGFVKDALPVLRRVAMVLKITNAVNGLLKLPGVGAASTAVSFVAGHCELLDWADQVLSQKFDADDGFGEDIAGHLQRMAELVKKADTEQEDGKHAIARQLYECNLQIRGFFESGKKQQQLRNLLNIINSEIEWDTQKRIGGLEKIYDHYGTVRWVCPKHARLLTMAASNQDE